MSLIFKRFFATFAVASFLCTPALALAQTSPSYYYPQSTYPYSYQTQYYSYPGYPTSYCPQLTYNLVRGSTDYYTQGQVSQLQRFIFARYGVSQQPTGYYGSLTAYYVARFQQEQGLYP